MKKIFLNLITGFILITLLITLTGCNSKTDVKYMSHNKMLSHVKSNIHEDIKYVQKYIGYHGENVYEFKLTERNNLIFKVKESISNHGLNLDGTQFYDNYERNIDFKNYMDTIFDNYKNDKKEILKKYELDKYQEEKSYDSKIIYVNDYTDFMNLSYCIAELDALYKFNINKDNVNYIDKSIGINVKSTDVYISTLSWSMNNKERIKARKFYKKLEEIYIKTLKLEGKVDPKVPKKIYNKY